MEDIHSWQKKFEPCIYSYKLINKITLLNKQANNIVDLNIIKKSIYYAKKYHSSQKRDSGEPYYTHPLAVAEMVSDYIFDTDILVTSILHDTIEDTTLTKKMIEMLFNANVAGQVEALTRVKIDRKITVTELIENLYPLKNRYDLLIIKYFDRIHNMQTINYKPPNKITKIVEETFIIFIAISIYLSSKNPALLKYEKQITKLCYQYMQLKQRLPPGSEKIFEDGFQLPFPTFQND